MQIGIGYYSQMISPGVHQWMSLRFEGIKTAAGMAAKEERSRHQGAFSRTKRSWRYEDTRNENMWNHRLKNLRLVSLDFAKAELLEERRQWILDYCQDSLSRSRPLLRWICWLYRRILTTGKSFLRSTFLKCCRTLSSQLKFLSWSIDGGAEVWSLLPALWPEERGHLTVQMHNKCTDKTPYWPIKLHTRNCRMNMLQQASCICCAVLPCCWTMKDEDEGDKGKDGKKGKASCTHLIFSCLTCIRSLGVYTVYLVYLLSFPSGCQRQEWQRQGQRWKGRKERWDLWDWSCCLLSIDNCTRQGRRWWGRTFGGGVEPWCLRPPVLNSQIETYHFADEVIPPDSSGHWYLGCQEALWLTD